MARTTDTRGNIIVRAQNSAVRELAYLMAIPGMPERIGALVDEEAAGDEFPLLEAIRREAAALEAPAPR